MSPNQYAPQTIVDVPPLGILPHRMISLVCMIFWYGAEVNSFPRGRDHPHYWHISRGEFERFDQSPFWCSTAPERNAAPHHAPLEVFILHPPLRSGFPRGNLGKPFAEAAIADVQAWPRGVGLFAHPALRPFAHTGLKPFATFWGGRC